MASRRGALTFRPVTLNTLDRVMVPGGYISQVLLRWGDPIHRSGAEFNFAHQTPEAQAQHFGYNADFISYFPLPLGSTNRSRALLVVNHEYTNPELMFPGYTPDAPPP